jgi:AcrR family transcriptional regulator
MAVKTRRDEYKELTRAAVLQAAADEFVAHGYARTTIDAVARVARVSKGAVYYHFADKADLFEAVFRLGQEKLLADVASTSMSRNDPWDQLDAALEAYIDGTVADPRHRALLQEAPGALGVDRCRTIDRDIALPVLLAALGQLDRTGQLAEHPSELLARVLFSALCEAAMTAGADRDPHTARRDAVAALRAITRGLRR